uniref:Uncharacterized protein n=1 Tax=Lactuca sativa TaxID=4236 RepID=A0A9R1V420_LACSA|nr:hypothetical protein LSAT_V11C700360170 [Lactuca sativa]
MRESISSKINNLGAVEEKLESQDPSRTKQEMQRVAQMIPCLKNGFVHKNYRSSGSLVFKNYERQDATLLSWNLMFIIFMYIFLVCITLLCRSCPLIRNLVLGYIVSENL